jgi:hypothetical protein
MTWRRRLAAACAGTVAVAPLVVPNAASAALSISSASTAPSSTQAGSHPNFQLSLRFSGDSTPKSLAINLPPGFVGNPNAAAKCPQATFQAGGCGADSVVGSTTVYTNAGLGGTAGGGGGGGGTGGGSGGGGGVIGGVPVVGGVCQLLPLPILCSGLRTHALRTGAAAAGSGKGKRALAVPITASGTVYNLEPNPGEPARLGIIVRPLGGVLGDIKLQSPVSVRDDGDFGLTSTLDNMPTTFNGLSTQITGMDLTLNGQTASGQDFVTLPTTCTPATTTVSVTPYSGGSDSASASFTPTGCGSVPFSPGLDVVPETTRVDAPSAFSIRIGVPGDEDPVRQSYVRTTTVTLPLGTGLNPGTAQGLEVCTDDQFAKGSRTAPSCPAASQVGTVAFTSPLVGTLNGTVYEGAPTPNQMLRLFVDVPGPGLRIKLVGNVNPDPGTGQVTSTFDNLPQLPFTAFALTFRGGDKAILTTPPTCGAATSSATLVPYSGGGAATPTSAFNVNWDGQGTACPDPLPFSPSVAVNVDPSTAGAATKQTATITRDERTQRLRDMKISFPPGLVGGLGNGIGLCDLAKAKAAQCGADSRVGSAALVAGPGGAPLTIQGDVYLTAPPQDGALAGLAITVPGKVGPFDLGTTVSIASIKVRPSDSGLDVTSSNLPQIVGGIPLGLRQIKLNLDRQGFMRNATSCAAQQLTATFTSTLNATATTTAPYQATDCDKVPFAPKLAGVAGKKGNASELSKGGHPTVTAVVSQTSGQIATKAVTVTLPKELGADIPNLNRTCPEGQDCGDRNIVGTATAITPLLPIPLTGDVRLVTPSGGGLPQLRLGLRGLLNIDLVGKTSLSKDGRVVNTFEGIPDVPLSRFELTIFGGKTGILVNFRALKCGENLTGNGDFVGHSGATKSVTGQFEVCGTLKSAAASRSAKTTATARLRKGRLTVRIHGAKKITAVKVGLPKGARLKGKRTVTKLGLKATNVTLKLGKKGLHGVKKGRKLTVSVTMGKAHATVRPKIR